MENGEGVYAFSAPLLDGHEVSFKEFRGEVLLIVNTASQCGFTPQYAGLEQLFLQYKEQGFSALGFPCNQFGRQEPGNAEQISAFCQKNYAVSFPIFGKIDVNGPDAHPLYRYLKKSRRGIVGLERISWNFTKFLIDRQGRVVRRFAPSRKPESLTGAIQALLGDA